MAGIKLRDVLAGLGAVSGGIATGRQVLRKRLEKEKQSAIERAKLDAEAELEREVSAVVLERMKDFLASTGVKALIVAIALGLRLTGDLSPRGLGWLVGIMVAIFFARDVVRLWPDARLAFGHLKRHAWNIRTAISEFVAVRAFETAYERAELGISGAKNVILFGVSGLNRQAVTQEIAEAVAGVVRDVAYEQIRARVLIALVQALAVSIVYGGFIFVALHL